MPALANFKYFGNMASVILFAMLIQLQFPSVSEFLKSRVINLKRLVLMISITVFVLYLTIGLIVPLAIHDVKGECNISFREFSAGYSQEERPWWTYLVSFVIVLFPALDVFSCFPIMAITLSDNLITLGYGAGEKVERKKVVIIKLIVITFPFILAFFVYDLVHSI